MDCFNHSCPFRVNETSNANRCECVACQNRSNGDFIITSNRTLTDDELAMLNALKNRYKDYGVGKWCQEGLSDGDVQYAIRINSTTVPTAAQRWTCLTSVSKTESVSDFSDKSECCCRKSFQIYRILKNHLSLSLVSLVTHFRFLL